MKKVIKQSTRLSSLAVEFDREADGRWIAEMPKLPGVMAYGATKREAHQRVFNTWSSAILAVFFVYFISPMFAHAAVVGEGPIAEAFVAMAVAGVVLVTLVMVFGGSSLIRGVNSIKSESKSLSFEELKSKRVRSYLDIFSGILAIVALVSIFTWFFLFFLFSALLLHSISKIMESEAQTVSPKMSAGRTYALIMFALSIAGMIFTTGLHFKLI